MPRGRVGAFPPTDGSDVTQHNEQARKPTEHGVSASIARMLLFSQATVTDKARHPAPLGFLLESLNRSRNTGPRTLTVRRGATTPAQGTRNHAVPEALRGDLSALRDPQVSRCTQSFYRLIRPVRRGTAARVSFARLFRRGTFHRSFSAEKSHRVACVGDFSQPDNPREWQVTSASASAGECQS
jgi:hypothetical protein